MRTRMPKIIVTGGAGFIGSAFVRLLLRRNRSLRRQSLVVIDKLTYAADLARLKDVKGKYAFYKADICDKKAIAKIFKKERPDYVVHFAAESHVDRSILSSEPFIRTNVQGTQVLLDAARDAKVKKFVHVSTDEVYGDIEKGEFLETTPLNPSSPYSASKAAADLLVKSYIRTFNFPAVIVRPSNNYGPWQYPEKFIPRAVLHVLKNKKIAVYAKGTNIREWLFVDDCAQGVLAALERGKAGQVYNLGSGQEKKNIDVARMILKVLGEKESLIEFVKDRPGHDLRYKLNSKKAFKEIQWKPSVQFEDGLRRTAGWCVAYKAWLLSKYRIATSIYK